MNSRQERKHERREPSLIQQREILDQLKNTFSTVVESFPGNPAIVLDVALCQANYGLVENWFLFKAIIVCSFSLLNKTLDLRR